MANEVVLFNHDAVLGRISNKPEEATYGIIESEELVRFIGRLTNAAVKAASDGKLGVTDAQYLFNVLPTINAAFQGIALVPKELGDLDSDERVRLGNVAAQEIKDIPNTAAKELALEGLGIGLQLVEYITKVRDLVATKKAADAAAAESETAAE